MSSLKTRIAQLERPYGGPCLVCELGRLNSADVVANCKHAPGLTLIDILKSLPLEQKPERDHAKS